MSSRTTFRDRLVGDDGRGGGDIDESDTDSIDAISDIEDTNSNSIRVYLELEDHSKDIPLQKVVFSPEGIALFDELCLRVDINQRYGLDRGVVCAVANSPQERISIGNN